MAQFDSTPHAGRLFHISEEPAIEIFEPRPSPSDFAAITSNVVFAISGELLHNYLLPRQCPRVTYYQIPGTSAADQMEFFGSSSADFIITVPSDWYESIKTTHLYCYEFAADNFSLLDECAGYYISQQPQKPIGLRAIADPIAEILSRNAELRFSPAILPLAAAVKKSTLGFSLIRMHNAKA